MSLTPTSYAVPTAYVVDSPSYVATSYVLNPSYAYVRRGWFGRTYVATSLSVVPSYDSDRHADPDGVFHSGPFLPASYETITRVATGLLFVVFVACAGRDSEVVSFGHLKLFCTS